MRDTHMDSPLAELYQPVDELVIPFDTGGKPANVSEVTSGGASISYQTTEGGFAELSTGTTSVGDGAEILTDPISPGRYDAISLSMVCDVSSGTTMRTDTHTFMQLQGQTSGELIHWLSRSYLDSATDSNNDRGDTMHVMEDTTPQRTTMLWDISNGEILHRFHDSLAHRYSPAYQPDPAQDFQARVNFQTQDTSTDRSLFLRQLEVGYWMDY